MGTVRPGSGNCRVSSLSTMESYPFLGSLLYWIEGASDLKDLWKLLLTLLAFSLLLSCVGSVHVSPSFLKFSNTGTVAREIAGGL